MLNLSKKKILIISHESSLTGAPILLINLLNLIKKYELFDFEILLYRGGILENEFKNLAKTDHLKKQSYSSERNLIIRIQNYIEYRLRLRKWKKKIKHFNLIFSNTITNGVLLKKLNSNKIPVISYVHELESIIQQYQKDAKLTLELSNFIAFPSKAVGENLRTNHSITNDKLVRLDYFFPFQESDEPMSKQELKNAFLERYKLPKNKFYVVSMGTATYRKGIDIFVQVCKELKDLDDVIFVWIGDFIEQEMKESVLKFVEENNLYQNFFITGYVPHSHYNLLVSDLFLLTSREDPYPLVVIEAAFNKIPSLTFKSGGIVEFVADDSGWVMENFSPKEMANKIEQIIKNPSISTVAGLNAYKKAIVLHSHEEKIISQLDTLLLKL